MNTDLLTKIKVILVHTSLPDNIGAAARAMKTMGLSQLVLVRPRKFPHPQANSLASGAQDILDTATVVDTLDQAIADCHWVVGTSTRERTIPWPQQDARAGTQTLLEHTTQGTTAIVFGSERMGLTNEELQLCNQHIYIPANPEYSSLNLAQAVQVCCYELQMATVKSDPKLEHPLANAKELAGFYEHLTQVLQQIDFLDPNNPQRIIVRLKRLFTKAQLEPKEVNILRGVLTELQKHLR